jgi:hypothetical protein
MSERLKLHEFMSDLYRSSDYDRTDQDAMGVFAWSGDRIIHSRPAVRAREFVLTNDKWLSLMGNPAKLYLCHQRGAMSPTKEINNHPFVGDNVALMHVGWISQHFAIAQNMGLELVSDTDTELFMRLADGRVRSLSAVQTATPVDILKYMLQMTREPTALALIDYTSENPAIWFGRNQHSIHPFHFYRIPRFKGVFLTATEAMMIIAEQLTFDYPREAVFKITDVEPNKVYQMRWDSDSLISFDQ